MIPASTSRTPERVCAHRCSFQESLHFEQGFEATLRRFASCADSSTIMTLCDSSSQRSRSALRRAFLKALASQVPDVSGLAEALTRPVLKCQSTLKLAGDHWLRPVGLVTNLGKPAIFGRCHSPIYRDFPRFLLPHFAYSPRPRTTHGEARAFDRSSSVIPQTRNMAAWLGAWGGSPAHLISLFARRVSHLNSSFSAPASSFPLRFISFPDPRGRCEAWQKSRAVDLASCRVEGKACTPPSIRQPGHASLFAASDPDPLPSRVGERHG